MGDNKFLKQLHSKIHNWGIFVEDTNVEDLEIADPKLAELFVAARDAYLTFVKYIERKAGYSGGDAPISPPTVNPNQ
jgi:hypothetical protein